MSYYGAKYENYYNKLLNKGKKDISYTYGVKSNNWVFKRIVRELCGSLFLFLLLSLCKANILPQSKELISYSNVYIRKGYTNEELLYQVKHFDYIKIQQTLSNYIEKAKSLGLEHLNN